MRPVRGQVATLTLAASDEEAESYAQAGDLGATVRALRRLTALIDVQTCGCSVALRRPL